MKILYCILVAFIIAIIRGISNSFLEESSLICNLISALLFGLSLYFITKITMLFEKKENQKIRMKSLMSVMIFSIFSSSLFYFLAKINVILMIIIAFITLEYSFSPFVMIEKNLNFIYGLIETRRISKNKKKFIFKEIIKLIFVSVIYMVILLFLLNHYIPNLSLFLEKSNIKNNLIIEIGTIPLYLFIIFYMYDIYNGLNYENKIDIRIRGEESGEF